MKRLFRLDIPLILFVILTFSCKDKKCPLNEKDSKIIFNLSDSSKRAFAGERYSREQIEQFLNNSTSNLLKNEILINNKQTLIEIAEPILFTVYGKENILDERPYEIYLFGDYWIMNGTMPRNMDGGIFTIAINRKTCKVIGITHGK